jgi:glycosyltransferase involved in cell wall biosynthesis
MIKISIVSPSFNQAPFLDEAIESVRAQGYPNLEHIVMDGASSDGSAGILQEKLGPAWKHLKWRSQRDRGQSDALNQGFRLATGDVIGWLNSDDRYRSSCLQTIAGAFEQYPGIDILYGDYTVIDATGKRLNIRREIEYNRFILFHYPTLCIPTPTAFFRRRIFDEGNWLDESLHYAMDHEFFARLASRGYRFKHLSALIADYRVHPASKSCSLPSTQIAESRAVMHRYSPVARRVKYQPLRALCFAILPIAAALARYTEKLVRGCYLPDSLLARFSKTDKTPTSIPSDKPLPGEP